QIYFFIVALLISVNSYSQLTITADGNGIVDFSYGASSDWSLYSPGFDPVVLYMWIDVGQNSQPYSYDDDWNGTLVNLSWNGTAHVGTVDFTSYNWAVGGVIPTGTTITDFNLILRNPAGDNQTGNLLASNFGYSLSVLPVEEFTTSAISIYSFENRINIKGLKSNESYTLSIFDTMGRQVKTITSNSDSVDISELHTAVYFLVLETAEGDIIRKKIIQ
ncbi:MAG: T9SS type A sorting domain-containing protein, partial [Urechidicola sp.]|nr:T9SS type A sorting domain-containing protein [Urechidicola sp.]